MFLQKFKIDSNGQALVEFALVLPILLIVVFGIVQFGIILNGYVSITHAAREGARMAAVGGAEGDVKDRVYRLAKTTGFINITENDVYVSYMPDIDEAYADPDQEPIVGDLVKIDIKDVGVNIIVPLINSIIGNSIPIASSATMRLEEGYRQTVSIPDQIIMDVNVLSISQQGNHLNVVLRVFDKDNDQSIQGVEIIKNYVKIREVDDEAWFAAPAQDKTTDINGQETIRFSSFFQGLGTKENFILIIEDGGLVKSGHLYPDGAEDNIILSFDKDLNY